MKHLASTTTLNTTDDALSKTNRIVFVTMLTCLLLLVMMHSAMAGTNSAMGDALCAIVDIVYGNLGRGLATLGIITLGIGALLGKTSWGLALTVGTGVAVIFNAGTIVVSLGVGASSC